MALHRYWRVSASATYLTTAMGCATLALHTVIGGSDVAPSGTAFANSNPGAPYLPASATDANGTTFWTNGGTTTGGLGWIGVDFGGSPKDIVEFAYTVRPDGFREDPKDFKFEYSDDNITYTALRTYTAQSPWTAGETRTFPAGPTVQQNTTQAYALAATGGISSANRTTQSYALTASLVATVASRVTQSYALNAIQTNTSIKNTQSYVLVAVNSGAEERKLRAWTFTQDDHDFYVLNLGRSMTLVYDKLTQQWCHWRSPNLPYWSGIDGCAWMGINIAADPDSNIIWKIDPDKRLDNNTTPITSIVYGGMTERFRDFVPCYMAEVAVSNANPPVGIPASSVGIRLRSSNTIDSWNDHGLITGLSGGNQTFHRYYGLGLMRSPGVLFEITDTGYARRIDGLNIETNASAGQQ